MVLNKKFWENKSVLITGHSGFKGGWLSLLLSELGARVHGYSLAPITCPSLFSVLELQNRIHTSTFGDILDYRSLKNALKEVEPEVIFHMAAQPLVRESYKSPFETFQTNVIGTINILEASRLVNSTQAFVNVTTDKCYDNKGPSLPYRESDRLGGNDPYSASKACSELVTSAYRTSFLEKSNLHIATVRAGNVIGGGDWAQDRLIPDILRSIDSGQKLKLRYPEAIRPWQHVLEPLSGYLMLAEKLYNEGKSFAEAWNFGPNKENECTVGLVVKKLSGHFPNLEWEPDNSSLPRESDVLKLDSSKAKSLLGWTPQWSLCTAIEKTADWYKSWLKKEDMYAVTSSQFNSYFCS